MFYIYDILLNFQEEIPYEFFEWRDEDGIEHLKKAPLYKVNQKTLKDFFYGKVIVSTSFLEEIKERSEIYQKGLIEKVPYLAIFTDGSLALGVEFNEKGENTFKSRFLLDEEEEILDFSGDLKETTLAYTCRKYFPVSFCTRSEKQIENFLYQEIQVALEEGNVEKIKYFYEECFEEAMTDIKMASKKLLDSLKKIGRAHKNLYQLLKRSYEYRK